MDNAGALLRRLSLAGLLGGLFLVSGCMGPTLPLLPEATGHLRHQGKYRIAPGDQLQIHVWRYPEVTARVQVRPDGYISAPLLEDVRAAGKTPTDLARDIEEDLSVYLRDPLVTVILEPGTTAEAGASGAAKEAPTGTGRGLFSQQIRVLGEVVKPLALSYQDGMTLVDLMIQVGGLTPWADANRAVLARRENGETHQYSVRLGDLLQDGDISANVDLRPGDILIVPKSWL